MRILVISSTAWNNNNSFGNSFSNIFEGMDDVEIANIYCSYGECDNALVKTTLQITEESLIKNFFKKGDSVAIKNKQNIYKEPTPNKAKIISTAKKQRFQIYFWIRDLVWKIGKWDCEKFSKFITDFNPDLIFQPIYYSNYISEIALRAKEIANVPMVGYISDDNYTLKQFNLSPLYWIDRLIKRKKIKKVIDNCEMLYVISEIQKKEYDKCFHKDCRLLYKCNSFVENSNVYNKINNPIKLVYAGNIGSKRYRQLALIGKAINSTNTNEKNFELDIYTSTPMNVKMKMALDYPNTINIKEPVPYDEILQIQKEADILVHVENFDLKSKLAVRMSFSTKLVDYFHQAKCIFAVGPKEVASMDYLIKNDAAITATSEKEIEEKLKMIIENPDIIKEYGDKAWECGKRNHQIDKIQKMLINDLRRITGDYV